MIGELKPKSEIMRHYTNPVPVRVPVVSYEVWDFTGEATVEVGRADGKIEAVVPDYVLNRDEPSVSGVALGMVGNMVVVSFPPTQLGEAKMLLPENVLIVEAVERELEYRQ